MLLTCVMILHVMEDEVSRGGESNCWESQRNGVARIGHGAKNVTNGNAEELIVLSYTASEEVIKYYMLPVRRCAGKAS